MDVQPRFGEADAEVQGWRVLTTRAKVEAIVIDGVFVMYLAFLVKLLLFSRAPGSERSINLIPFASTATSPSVHRQRRRDSRSATSSAT